MLSGSDLFWLLLKFLQRLRKMVAGGGGGGEGGGMEGNRGIVLEAVCEDGM